jgi:hypothetical protein
MKRLLLSTFLGVLTLVATAQTQPETAVQVRGYQIELPAKPYRMFPGDFDIYKGAYDLSNGETMVLNSRGRRMFAEVGDRPRVELVAASPHEFVAVDRQLKMKLQENFGEITGEVLLVVPRQSSQQSSAADTEVLSLLASR